MENIEKIWADGLWLRDFFDRHKQALPDNPELLSKWEASNPPVSKTTGDYLLRLLQEKDAWLRCRDELITLLSCGRIEAIGRNLRAGLHPRLESIPKDFWSTSEIDLDQNSAEDDTNCYDRIKVHANANQDTGNSFNKSNSHRLTSNPDRYPEPGGATSFERFRRKVLIACLEEHADFPDWSTKNQHREAVRMAKKLYDRQGVHEKFGRSSFFATRKKLIEAGVWLSKNVQ